MGRGRVIGEFTTNVNRMGEFTTNANRMGEMSRNSLRNLTLCVAAALLILLCVPNIYAQGVGEVKIGVVDFQKVLNLSEAGKRSKKILFASKEQKENELKSVGEQLKKENEALKNNILLTDAAKAKKQNDLRGRERQWRNEFKAAERDLQRKQLKASESIFTEVQTVINLIAKEGKFDFVIEKSTARAILFSRGKMEDITDAVIKRYNDISR